MVVVLSIVLIGVLVWVGILTKKLIDLNERFDWLEKRCGR